MATGKRIRFQEGSTDLDMTALIDVIFLLIIFFMLACRLKDQEIQAVLELPKSSTIEVEEGKPPENLLVINLESTQTEGQPIVVRIGGKPYTLVKQDIVNPTTKRLDGAKYEENHLQKRLYIYTSRLRDYYADKYKANPDNAIPEHSIVKLRIDKETQFMFVKELQDQLTKWGIKNIAYGAIQEK